MSRDIQHRDRTREGALARRKNLRKPSVTGDSIDRFMRQWRSERPDLDPAPISVFARIFRLFWIFSRRADIWLGDIGLTWEAFSLIVTLRRSGRPYALRPSDLLRESLLSSGAMTNRIDRVEQLGLVRRVDDPKDRRGVVVRLTPEGRTLADRAIARHFSEISRLLSGLTPTDRRTTAALLSKLLLSLEGPDAVASHGLRAKRNTGKPLRRRHNPSPAASNRTANAFSGERKPTG